MFEVLMKPTSKKLPGWVHLPLFVFMAISFYQTAKGFSDLLGAELAWAFSLALTMMMYGLTIFIGIRRLNSFPILGLLSTYFICSLFSFAGNFNAVYSTYQEEQLYRDELLKHKQQLNDVLSAANKALDNFSPDIDLAQRRVDSLTMQLVSQITDPTNPGLGERSEQLINEIEQLLGEKITRFGGKTGIYTNWGAIAQLYKDNIAHIAKRKLTSNDYQKVEVIRQEITQKGQKLDQTIDSVLSSSDSVKQLGYDTNLSAVNVINQIGSQVQEFINDSHKFNFEKVQFESQEFKKIAFSFKSAFTQHFFVALLLGTFCIFIDWAVILMISLFFGRNVPEIPETTKQSTSL